MITTRRDVEYLKQILDGTKDMTLPISTEYLKGLLTSWIELDDELKDCQQMLQKQKQDKYRILIETTPKVYESQLISLDEIIREELLRYILNKNNSQ